MVREVNVSEGKVVVGGQGYINGISRSVKQTQLTHSAYRDQGSNQGFCVCEPSVPLLNRSAALLE